MNRLLWTELALQDLQWISTYIEGKSDLATANRICRTIYNSVQQLRRFPESGKEGLEAGTRELVIPNLPYIVVYRITFAETLEVLRIWHGAQSR